MPNHWLRHGTRGTKSPLKSVETGIQLAIGDDQGRG
jgi:hypothetical protein